MKTFSIRLAIALSTFAIGISSTIFWFYYSCQPKVQLKDTEIITACDFSDYTEHRVSESGKRFWNKEILGRFKEHPLENPPDYIDESYRFTLIPTFDAPVSIRVWRIDNQYFMTVKKLSGQGGFGIKKFGSFASEQTRTLTEDEWLKFTSLLDESWFWSESPLVNEDVVNDGEEWIMEGIKQDKGLTANYHEVHRIMPKQEFRDACNYLLKLTGLEKQYKGYYEERYSS